MEIAFQAGAILSLIALIAFLILGRKSWKFFHSFMVFLLLPLVVTFSAYAALVLKTRTNWEKAVMELTEAVDTAATEKSTLIDGDRLAVEQTEDSLKIVKQELRRVLDGRGRVWRECQVTNAAATSIELSTAPPADAGGAAPAPNQIVLNSNLTAYKEEIDPEISEDWKVPTAFLGQFTVTAVTDTTVTLRPTIPFDTARDDDQIQQINNRDGSTWVLYERTPVDGHDIFQDKDKWTKEALEQEFPRDQLKMTDPDPEKDAKLLAQYGAMIEEYLFDKEKIADLKGGAFDPPPNRRGIRVKFTVDETIEVDVDPTTRTGPDVAGNAFDPDSGKARIRSLLQIDPKTGEGYPTQFEVGDEFDFDQETANELINAGKAELVYPVFVRELKDYELSFAEIQRQRVVLMAKKAAADRDTNDLTVTKNNVEMQVALRDAEIAKLNEDLTNHKKEVQLVSAHRVKLEAEWAKLQGEIRALYFANQQYEAQLAAMQKKLVDEIERRTRQATVAQGK